MLSNYPTCCDSCRNEYRNQRLAELYRIIEGDYRYSGSSGSSNNFPSSPIVAKDLKAGSNLNLRPITATRPKGKSKRIVLHPERAERNRRLAELLRFIRG